MTKRHRLRPCAALAAVLLLGTAGTAAGAQLTFAPAGTQLDGDAILDIVPGGQITFDVSIDTAGLGGVLTALTYEILYDQLELRPAGTILDVGGVFGGDSVALPADPANPGTGIVTHGAGNLAPGFNAVVDRITFDTLVLMNTGASDFLLRVTRATATIAGTTMDVTAAFRPNPFVEVQPAAVAEPSSLGLLGAGVLALLWRRARGRRRAVA